jgi:WD40 repeat protein
MRLRQALVAPLAVAAVACLTGCVGRTTAADGAPRVLLSSDRDGETRAYSVRPDGSRLTPLLPRSRALRPAAVSRDGGTIAYGAFSQPIDVSRASGAGLHQVVRAANDVALSRDGKRLAYSTGDERGTISVVGTDGRGRRRLPGFGYRPDWSPDGKALVLLSDISEDEQAVVVESLHGGRHRIARGGIDSGPTWSPDGRWIAYTDTSSNPAGNDDLFVVRPDGTHRHRVARNIVTFAWSPDGTKLAAGGHFRDVAVVGVDGRGLRWLGLRLSVGTEAWSPDGRRLVLAANGPDDPTQIWLVGSNGRGLRRITGVGHNELVGWTRLAPVRPVAPRIPPSERVVDARTVATRAPVTDLSADGSRVAFVVAPTPLDCDHVAVWTTARRSLRRFGSPASCGGVPSLYELELAGSRVAWISYGCGTTCDFVLKTLTLADPRPVWLAENGFASGGGQLWDYHLRGDGDLLVFDDRLGLVRIGAGRQQCARPVPLRSRRICTVLRSGEYAEPVDSVSGRLVAVREPDGVAVLDERGTLVRFLSFEPADVTAALLDGGRLVVARASTLEAFDAATGARLLSRRLPDGYRLVDVDDGIAVLIHADTIELLRLADGRSTTLTPGRGPVFADLEPAGLYYSYADGTGGRVVFVPRPQLLR